MNKIKNIEIRSKLKLVTVLIFSSFIITVKSSAQTTPVQIIDPSVIPILFIDTITGDPIIDTVQQHLLVCFKVSHPELASKAWYYLGSAPDSGNVMIKYADFIQINNIYYLSMDNKNREIRGGFSAEVMIDVMINQMGNFKFTTIFVEDTTGVNTDRIYLRFQN